MPNARTIALLLLALSTYELVAQEVMPRACRSVHLWWKAAEGGVQKAPTDASAFYNEVTVTKSTRGSYFAVCGFSRGYFGIQELGNGKKVVIFSIWEPGKQNNPNATPEERRVKEVASGEGVRVKRFGGEGTGGQSFYDYDWKVGETVRFVVHAKPDGDDRTQYAGFVYLPQEERWQHMATFSTLAGGHLLRGYYSFVEDFLRNGKSATISRRAVYGNCWIRTEQEQGSKWIPLTEATFTADNTPTMNIDSGVDDERVFLQTGGDTENTSTKLRARTKLVQQDRKPPLDLPEPFAAKTRPNGVRILAYNIKHGRGNDGKVDLERIARVIRRLSPDVVALQEIDNVCERSGKVDETQRLAELTGLPHHAFGQFFDFQGGEYGMAILSRFPLSDITNLRLPDGAEPRTSLVATIRSPQPFRIADVHFYRTEEQRMAQATTLLEFLKKSDIPTIVAGDFNSQPDSPVLDLFGDWSVPVKGEDRLTFSSDKPRREIDFILFRPESHFTAKEIDVIKEPVASDHRPLTLELEVAR